MFAEIIPYLTVVENENFMHLENVESKRNDKRVYMLSVCFGLLSEGILF